MTRRRVLNNKPIELFMDVVFANKLTKELTIVKSSEISLKEYPESIYEPIGIVVIPGEHGVLKDGTGTKNQCGVMSIVPMNCNTPETGGSIEQTMRWGGYGTDISGKTDSLNRYDSVTNGLLNYQRVVTGMASSNNATGLNNANAYIPYQRSVGSTLIQNSPSCAPSPYAGSDMMSGGYNEAYGTTEFDTGEPNLNVLADFKGIVNTKILTDLATKQSGWRTANYITNSSSSGYYPAACCCARFHTTGTKAFVDCTTEELKHGTGFWYLPAMGELGYIMPRFADINDIISKLYDTYGIGVTLNTNNDYLSSSEYHNNGIYAMHAKDGKVTMLYKETMYYTRAFLRL